MPNRQKLLIAVLGLVAVVVGGDYAYRTWYEQPLAELERKQEAATKRIQELKVEVAKAEKQAERLVQLKKRSLPGDISLARNRYQRWMLQLVGKAKLKSPRVNAAPPVNNKNMLYRMSFTLQAKGDLGQITKFLHEFYSTGYLHKITALNLTPRSAGSTDLVLGVDVLVLPRSDGKKIPPSAKKLAFASLAEYRSIPRKNIFGESGFDKFANGLSLTGITQDSSGEFEAWLSREGTTTILKRGDSIAAELVTLEIAMITSDTVTCNVDGQELKLRIGDTLARAAR